MLKGTECKRKLNIWLIKEGEALPVTQNARLMRTGMLAKYLSEQGHQVIWWSSTYIHGTKKYFCNEKKEILINDKEVLALLHSNVSYKKNISIQRAIYQSILAKKFKKQSREKEKPDIIVCSWPLISLAKEAVRYGKEHQVPVILDVRDQWPDIFVRVFPAKLYNFADLFLKPLKWSAANILKKAYGITSTVDSFLLWACKYAGRVPGENDRTVYIGNKREDISEEEYNGFFEKWKDAGIKTSDWIICFFGTFGAAVAIDVVIKAVKELSADYPDIKFVIGGSGDREAEFRNAAGDCPNIYFGGWLNNKEMISLMRMAKCGAYSYKNTFDFKDNFSNKAIQYISERLPILNSLSGFPKTLIEEKKMGITYDCDSVQDCKEKIKQLYNDEAGRRSMGENALKCFSEMFESEVVNSQFEEYLVMMHDKYDREHKK